MPSTVKIRVVSARNLPEKVDEALVEVRGFSAIYSHVQAKSRLGTQGVKMTSLAREIYHTKTVYNTLTPMWGEDFRFDVSDDALMQDEPIAFRVLDGDALIGTVYIPLHPLMRDDNDRSSVAGWFPIYDTLQGIRGELRVSIKLQFIENENPFKDSSAGVRFYGLSTFALNTGEYGIENVLGVADELVVHKDPEYEWKDSIERLATATKSASYFCIALAARCDAKLAKRLSRWVAMPFLDIFSHLTLRATQVSSRAAWALCASCRSQTCHQRQRRMRRP